MGVFDLKNTSDQKSYLSNNVQLNKLSDSLKEQAVDLQTNQSQHTISERNSANDQPNEISSAGEDSLLEFARYLGMDLPKDNEFLWIAQAAMAAPLPPPWLQLTAEDGQPYFVHSTTQQTQWEHPLDCYHRDLYLRVRADREARRGAPTHAPSVPASGTAAASATVGSAASPTIPSTAAAVISSTPSSAPAEQPTGSDGDSRPTSASGRPQTDSLRSPGAAVDARRARDLQSRIEWIRRAGEAEDRLEEDRARLALAAESEALARAATPSSVHRRGANLSPGGMLRARAGGGPDSDSLRFGWGGGGGLSRLSTPSPSSPGAEAHRSWSPAAGFKAGAMGSPASRQPRRPPDSAFRILGLPDSARPPEWASEPAGQRRRGVLLPGIRERGHDAAAAAADGDGEEPGAYPPRAASAVAGRLAAATGQGADTAGVSGEGGAGAGGRSGWKVETSGSDLPARSGGDGGGGGGGGGGACEAGDGSNGGSGDSADDADGRAGGSKNGGVNGKGSGLVGGGGSGGGSGGGGGGDGFEGIGDRGGGQVVGGDDEGGGSCRAARDAVPSTAAGTAATGPDPAAKGPPRKEAAAAKAVGDEEADAAIVAEPEPAPGRRRRGWPAAALDMPSPAATCGAAGRMDLPSRTAW